MLNLLKKIWALLLSKFRKSNPTPAPAPVAPTPIPTPSQVVNLPPVSNISDATRAAEAGGETFAQWLLRVHPEVSGAVSAVVLAATPFLNKGMSFADAFAAIKAQPDGAPVATPAPQEEKLPRLPDTLLALRRGVYNTDSYMIFVDAMTKAGYSDVQIRDYIQAYGPGGYYYGQ